MVTSNNYHIIGYVEYNSIYFPIKSNLNFKKQSPQIITKAYVYNQGNQSNFKVTWGSPGAHGVGYLPTIPPGSSLYRHESHLPPPTSQLEITSWPWEKALRWSKHDTHTQFQGHTGQGHHWDLRASTGHLPTPHLIFRCIAVSNSAPSNILAGALST